MKTPAYKEINIPKEVIRFANNVKEEPRLYYGMKLEYEYIIWPENQNDLLVLRCYKTSEIKDNILEDEEIPGCEEWVTYIDVDNERWKVRKSNGKWGSAKIESLISWNGYRVKILNHEVVREYKPFAQDNVYDSIVNWQGMITRRKLAKRQQRKDERVNVLMEQARPLPKNYLHWHEETVMKDSRYLIYTRSSRRQFEAFCTHCETTVRIRREECKMNNYTKCPSCGSRVTMKPSGRIKGLYDVMWSEYIQDIKDGIMIRFIKMEKDYRQYGIVRKIVREPARVIIQRGKKAVWYERRDGLTKFASQAEYQRNNTEGCIRHANFPSQSKFGMVYRKNLRAALKKAFPYHTFWEFQERQGQEIHEFEIYDYFDAYSVFPMIESLEKTGKTELVDYLCEGHRNRFKEFNKKAKTVSDMVGITRQQYRMLRNPSMDEIKIMRILKKKNIELKGLEFIQMNRCIGIISGENDLDTILEYMTIKKFIGYANRKDKYEVRNYYFDYLRMGERLGYDFSNKAVLFPDNIKNAHDEAIALLREQAEKIKIKEAKKEDKSIRKVEEKIRKKFSYEDDSFLIRPAKTAREIVIEGQKQHICVGNGFYTKNMAKGKRYILLLRKKEMPDDPFYTVEITPEYDIVQRHGKYNQEGEEVKDVDNFLKKFVEVKGNGKEYHAAGR